MQNIKGSITHRRSRSNVESDLRIFDDNHLLISSPPSDIGSISFFIEKTANLGRLFTKGTTTIDVSDIVTGTGKKTHIIYNDDGFVYNDGIKGAAHALDFTVAGDITIGDGGADNEDFTISQLQFFEDTADLSQQEVDYNYRNGGLIADSKHDTCLAHYPLTERYAFKADAAFIVKHTQFSVGDNVFFDTVEQYNYAKGAAISSNHSEAVNFTDAEVGTGGDVRTQSVKKEFYPPKATNIWYEGAGDPDPANMIEKDTLLPPILQGFTPNINPLYRFKIPGASPMNPTNEKGYTFVFMFAGDLASFASNSFLFSNRGVTKDVLISINTQTISVDSPIGAVLAADASPQNMDNTHTVVVTQEEVGVNWIESIYLNGNLINSHSSVNSPDMSSVNGDTNLFRDVAGGANELVGTKIMAGLWKDVFSQKKIKQIANNILLSNIVIDDDCQLYCLFNESSFTDDAANIILEDFSPQNQVIQVTESGGGSLTGQLATVVSFLVDIDDLR